MPLVRIDMIAGKSPEYKKNVLNCIHDGLAKALEIPDWDRFQRIVELPREDFETAPGKSDAFLIIELALFPGRTREQKAMRYTRLPPIWKISLALPPKMCLSSSMNRQTKTGVWAVNSVKTFGH